MALPASRRAFCVGAAACLIGCGPDPMRGRQAWSAPPEPVVPLPAALSIRDVRSGARYWSQDFARLLADPALDFVVLGEIHDNPDHHRFQAWAVSMLDQLRPPARPSAGQNGVAGLAFEMIPAARAHVANRFRAGRAPSSVEAYAPLGEELAWAESGWPDFAMYAEILLAAPAATVAGGGVDRAALRRAAEQGAASWPDAARFGLDQALAPAEAARRAQAQVDSHCGMLPIEAAPALVDAQRIRDAAFADALLRAAEDGFAVLITGNGHARVDWGAPRFLRRLAPDARGVSVGLLEAPEGVAPDRADLGRLGAPYGDARPPFDYVVVTPHRPREDPCVAFRAQLEAMRAR